MTLLARVMLKDGQVFTSAAAARAAKGSSNVVQIGRVGGLNGLKTTLSDLFTDAETARILTTNRGPLRYFSRDTWLCYYATV